MSYNIDVFVMDEHGGSGEQIESIPDVTVSELENDSQVIINRLVGAMQSYEDDDDGGRWYCPCGFSTDEPGQARQHSCRLSDTLCAGSD